MATDASGATRSLLLELLAHMEWADAEVWRAVTGCERADEDPGLRERLHHVHLVQRAFLHLWRGEPVDGAAGSDLDLRALARWAAGYYPEAREHLERAPPEAFDAIVAIPWSAHVRERLGIEPAPTTLRDTALQVYAHTAHHRGQVMLQLRALGATPPLVDYIAWTWRGRPAPAWT